LEEVFIRCYIIKPSCNENKILSWGN